MLADEKRRRVAECPYWWHSIDLGDGVITPGLKFGGGIEVMRQDAARVGLPADLTGRSVLDIGAYDGFYSFEAERRGAARVVALDHFVWLNDVAHGRVDYGLQYLRDGRVGPGTPTPGKRPFDVAHELLGSRVESVVGDFMSYPLEQLGVFDVVLYLGVLYHMEEPLRALRRVFEVTREVAIIESEFVALLEHESIAQFFPGAELNNDPTNWWVPNIRALVGLAQAAGFGRVELVAREPEAGAPPGQHGRATIHAWRT
jgi:tRNA (mo5U34)-methyltransferase